jgi:hypothetical protein
MRRIKIKSGLDADINTAVTKSLAVLGELHYATDTKILYIFDGTNNIPVSSKPVHLADADAENDSIYYSTDAGKLVYKDSGGTVNDLY